VLVTIVFIRFFIFGATTPAPAPSRRIVKKRSSLLRNPLPATITTILSKTYYNVSSHQPESLDWFNVLIAQTLAQFRADAVLDDALLNSLRGVLNGGKKPDFLGEVTVSEVALGEEFPIFSNCRISPSEDDPGQLQARMDVDLNDVLTLGIETKLLLNWPRPLVAVLPVALAVSILRFSGTLQIAFIPSPEGSGNSTTLAFSFLDDYRLDISVRSLLGSRSRLQDVPKIAQLVETRLHQWIDERCVEPRFQQIVLPSLWPRKKTTREQQRQGEEETLELGADGVRRRRGTFSQGLGSDLR
jgi:maintenance of morphology protein 1